MRKSVWIFLLAVLVPSAVLGWLALRTAEEQKIILERRTAELYQHETEGLAAAARAVIDEQRRGFSEAVRVLLADSAPDAVAQEFAVKIGDAWNRKAVGFAIGRDGRLVSPSARAAANQPEWQRFLWDHGSFLGGKLAASVYNVPVDALTQPEVLRKKGLVDNNDSYGNRMNSWKNGVAVRSKASQSLEVPGNGNANANGNREAKDAVSVPAPEADKKRVAAAAAAAPEPKVPAREVTKMLPPPATVPTAPAAPAEKAQTYSRMNIEGGSKGLPNTKELPSMKGLPDTKSLPSKAPAPAPAPMPQAPVAVAPVDQQQRTQMPSQAASRAAEGETKSRAESSVQKDQQLQQQSQQPQQAEPQQSQQQLRNVQPQQMAFELNDRPAWSNLAPEMTEFRVLCEGANEGVLTRFVQDKLALIFWLRPAQSPDLVFGCVVDAANLGDLWPAIMPEPSHRAEYVLALLDDRARPVATSANGSSRDWKRPFVASEIGEALPHWEAALYLMRPEQLAQSATGLRRTLSFLVVGLLGAILLGGWLVAADARRQLALAQQKTDFVSNVSHELKTPLTSIRMFAELMLGGRPETQAKAPQYLRIIMVEAERLTRLINNVLDFAKLERRQKRVERKPLDLHEVLGRVWESHELHLRESGFETKWEAASPPYRVEGDEDALAQILVNLLSNAEKYSGERKEVELHSYTDRNEVCVAVLDRGAGVPAGEERKIFEAFYRAHDSLSSGIQGSGLGLTLALRLAQEMGGRVEYRRREGGGSEFALWMPLVPGGGTH